MTTQTKKSSFVGYIQQEREFDYLVNLVKNTPSGKANGILLVGPPGTGKTLCSISLAKKFGAPYYIIDGSSDLDRRDIEGTWELRKGDTHFSYGPLTLALRGANEKGIAFLIINEINAIRENEQISLNSLLSESHINLISKSFERHELAPNCKLIIIGTLNYGVLGINKLQEAFEDRFSNSVDIGYPPKDKEIQIVSKVAKCDQKIAEIVVDTGRQIRKLAIQDFTLTKIFSTRLAINFCSLITNMDTSFLRDNIKYSIINKLAIEKDEKKSIEMILDGKMFEEKLREVLIDSKRREIHRRIEHTRYSTGIVEEKFAIVMNDYEEKFGHKVFTENGKVKLKPLAYLWNNEREIFYDIFELTVNNLGQVYGQSTGSKCLFKNKVTFGYVKWLVRFKNKELSNFINKLREM